MVRSMLRRSVSGPDNCHIHARIKRLPMKEKDYEENEENEQNENEKFVGKLVLSNGYQNTGAMKVNGGNETGLEIIGDANGDGYITSFDAIYILKYSISGVEFDEDWIKRFDVDGDGEVTASDAVDV